MKFFNTLLFSIVGAGASFGQTVAPSEFNDRLDNRGHIGYDYGECRSMEVLDITKAETYDAGTYFIYHDGYDIGFAWKQDTLNIAGAVPPAAITTDLEDVIQINTNQPFMFDQVMATGDVLLAVEVDRDIDRDGVVDQEEDDAPFMAYIPNKLWRLDMSQFVDEDVEYKVVADGYDMIFEAPEGETIDLMAAVDGIVYIRVGSELNAHDAYSGVKLATIDTDAQTISSFAVNGNVGVMARNVNPMPQVEITKLDLTDLTNLSVLSSAVVASYGLSMSLEDGFLVYRMIKDTLEYGQTEIRSVFVGTEPFDSSDSLLGTLVTSEMSGESFSATRRTAFYYGGLVVDRLVTAGTIIGTPENDEFVQLAIDHSIDADDDMLFDPFVSGVVAKEGWVAVNLMGLSLDDFTDHSDMDETSVWSCDMSGVSFISRFKDIDESLLPLVEAVCDAGLEGGCPCGNNPPSGIGGCANENVSTGAILSGAGSPVVGSTGFGLAVEGMPANKFAIVFAGIESQNPVDLGNGLLCVAAPFQRSQTFQSDASGNLLITDIHGDSLHNFAENLTAGSPTMPVSVFQVWYRDPNGLCPDANVNLSNALRVRWLSY